MLAAKNFKTKLILVYFACSILAMGLMGFILKRQWDAFIKASEIVAAKDLVITAGITNNILLNASKLLDITNRELYQLIMTNHFDASSVKNIFTLNTSYISLDNDIKNYGILLLVDKEGDLIARSDGLNSGNFNFKDREYFQYLKNNQDERLTIGPLLQSRTTKKNIFHLAVPVKDGRGQFNGALVLQISENSITNTINIAIGGSSESLTALTTNNKVIFSTLLGENYPNSNTSLTLSDLFQNLTLNTESSLQRNNGFIVSQLYSPALKIKFVLVQSVHKMFAEFLRSNRSLFIIVLLSYCVFSYLIWIIYKQFFQSEKARLKSLTDQLTGLPNRRAFDERYETFLKDSERNHSEISVLFIDIDKFKNCNDDYGHENGDLVLKALAKIIQGCMRRPLDFCCRWGGEELVALLPDTGETGATSVAQSILDTVRQSTITLDGYPPIKITVSVGIACAHHKSLKALDNSLVDRADQAMYRAKQAGRDRLSL